VLQALEAKMARLNVYSERYLSLLRGWGRIGSSELSGHKRVTHTWNVRVTHLNLIEVGLSPPGGEIFGGSHLTEPDAIVVGSSTYEYTPKGAIRVCGRPWVKRQPVLSVEGLFPYHGSGGEVSLGGTGGYAGLINLLATAVGGVSTVGVVNVAGQPTTEFTARVRPQLLANPASGEEPTGAGEQSPTTLSVFISGSGLPVQVVEATGSGHSEIATTTRILAVNVPISVKPPAARETISAQVYEQGSRSSSAGSVHCPGG
jgi:hypothetical protein